MRMKSSETHPRCLKGIQFAVQSDLPSYNELTLTEITAPGEEGAEERYDLSDALGENASLYTRD